MEITNKYYAIFEYGEKEYSPFYKELFNTIDYENNYRVAKVEYDEEMSLLSVHGSKFQMDKGPVNVIKPIENVNGYINDYHLILLIDEMFEEKILNKLKESRDYG